MIWSVRLNGRIGDLGLDIELEGGLGPLALIGPNGAGKTTLLRWIAGARFRADGEVRVGDALLYSAEHGVDLCPEERRVAYLPQGYGLFPHLSGLKNVAFGLGRAKMPGNERRAVAMKLLGELDALQIAERLPSTMSGGERQKVALARALVMKPRLMLLDEPMAALDTSSRRRTRAFLGSQISKLGTPAIVVTHDPRDVWSIASEVAVIEKGRVAQRGSPTELAKEPATDFVAEFFDMAWQAEEGMAR